MYLTFDVTEQQLVASSEKLAWILHFLTFVRARLALFYSSSALESSTSEFSRNFIFREGVARYVGGRARGRQQRTHREREWKKVERFAQTFGEYRGFSVPLFAPLISLCRTVISTSFTYCRSLRALSAGLYGRHILRLNLRFALPGSFN